MIITHIPTTTITHSLEMETRRILYLTNKLPTQAYQDRGFFILPEKKKGLSKNLVVFPDLPYEAIPDFWHRVSKLTPTTPIKAPNDLLYQTKQIVKPYYDSGSYLYHQKRLLGGWKDIEEKFWSNLFTLFPKYSGKIKKVNIYLTQSGPTTSFRLLRGSDTTIDIMARLDTPLDKILWSILTCLFRPKMQDKLGYSWLEIQATIDWLMEESILSSGIDLSSPVITQLRNPQLAKWKQASLKYQKKLGFSGHNLWEKRGKHYHYGSLRISNLSPNEELLLEVLLANYGSTVSNAQIITSLWPKNNEITDWAVTKQIQRLRDKLKKSGITHPVIQAHRSQGYSLI